MNRPSLKVLLFVTVPTIILSVIGLVNLSLMSTDGIKYKNQAGPSIVSFVPADSPGYDANIQINDTVLSINNRTFKSVLDMKRNTIEKAGEGRIAVYEISRNGKLLRIPVKMAKEYSGFEIFSLTTVAMIFVFSAIVFYVTFPFVSGLTFIIFAFYQIITLIMIYSNVNFLVKPLYAVLAAASSFAPSMIIYLSQSLNKETNFIIRILPSAVSLCMFAVWIVSYWIFSSDPTFKNFTGFVTVLRIVQVFISAIIVIGIRELILSLSRKVKRHEKLYISYILTFLLMGFAPFIILYAVPMAIGRAEILSIWIAVSFSIIPLIGIIIFNSFFFRLIDRRAL